MTKIILILNLFLLLAINCFAQLSDGTVRSLVNAEEYFKHLVKTKGINKAFLKVADKDGVVFRPQPLSIKEFYKKTDTSQIEWKPEWAMIAKTGDFGFTTGPYEVTAGLEKFYGHYLSVWKANNKGKWKLVLDGGISHPKSLNKTTYEYLDPSDRTYYKLQGPQKIKMRQEIVFSTDELLGKTIAKDPVLILNEFYDEKVRLYIDGTEPIIGKENVLKYFEMSAAALSSKPDFVDRAFSGDLAYSYGTATINDKKYQYIRIWKISDAKKWNIILEAYIKD